MKTEASTLIFLTAEFPYRKQESFIENELPYLAETFDKVALFPYVAEGAPTRDVPGNVKVRPERPGCIPMSSMVFTYFGLFFSILWREFWGVEDKLFFLRRLKHWIAELSLAIQDGDWLLQAIDEEDKPVFYSFWMNQWALALALLKKRGLIDRFQFNCAGFDIWDERHEGNYLPFRRFIYSQTERVMPNTKMGEAYIREKGFFPEKVQMRYWGTMDFGTGPFDPDAPFTILSISNLIPLKRVHLIIEILQAVSRPVRWVHFGEGPLMEEIQALAAGLPSHIRSEFKGRVSNEEYRAFFATESVNLFITTSESEGLPVSIMEAMSYGIPTMATRVGGIPEEVVPATGMLIAPDFDPAAVAGQLVAFMDSEQNQATYREGIRAYWAAHFDANQNQRAFARRLRGLAPHEMAHSPA